MASYSDLADNLKFIQTAQENAAQDIAAIASVIEKGKLLVGNGTQASTLDPSTASDGDVLVRDSNETVGLKWTAPVSIAASGVTPGSYTLSNLTVNEFGQVTSASNGSVNINTLTPTTIKGDLLVQTSTTMTRLPLGSNGQYLSVNSTTPSGLAWKTVDVNDLDPTVNKGDILVQGAASLETLGVGTGNDKKFLIADSGEPNGLRYGSLSEVAPTTTKGDLLTLNNLSAVDALSLGAASDGDILTVDTSVVGTGLAWKAPNISNYTPTSNTGEILVQSNTGDLVPLSVGTDGQVLTVNTGITTVSMEWATPGTVGSSGLGMTLLTQGSILGYDNTTPFWTESGFNATGDSLTSTTSDAYVFNFPVDIISVECRFIVENSYYTPPVGNFIVKLADATTGVALAGTETPYDISAGNITDGRTSHTLTTPYPANTDFILRLEWPGAGTIDGGRFIFFITY